MRFLSDLVDEVAYPGWHEIVIRGITADSRQVRPGFMFAAFQGIASDGRAYIPSAIEQGAAAILTDVLPEGMKVHKVPVIHVENPRHMLAIMAARFYGKQPEWIAAVTGTDGKTSTAHFYQQLWKLMGYPAASIGTLGVVAPEGLPEYPAVNTTPDPVLLHKTLAELASHHVNHVAIEASSHGLDQHRLDGVKIRVAGFTNLSRDHLDYHHTVEAYFRAKLRLFTDLIAGGAIAILNADDAQFAELRKACSEHGHRVMSYGHAGEELKLISSKPYARGQQVVIEIHGQKLGVDIPLIGGFQVMNILCAAGMALASGAEIPPLVNAMGQLSGVPGRLEHAATHPNGAPVFVDYAHTPGGLESMLGFVRPHVSGRLHLVFGCGGDRDRGKRSIMGEIAARLADVAVVTDDNPRSEDAASIRAEVKAGCPDAQEIGDRREAIFAAVVNLQPGDALVIAGKGHEKMQIIGGVSHPFDDVEIAKQAVSALK